MILRTMVLAIALLGAACGAPESRQPSVRNLIVITVDTLRADHMSLHGYGRETTPLISAFARRAVTFDRAIAPWPKTVPSMVSMFTGLYPHRTGIMFGSRGKFIPDQEILLQEIASANGLNTAGVVSNAVLSSASNFDQGFDRYIETYDLESPVEDAHPTRADVVNLLAQSELRRLVGAPKPFFLWVHFIDPHAPYAPPDPWGDEYHGDALYDSTPLRLNDEGNFHGGIAPRYWKANGEQKEWGWYVAQYDGEIAFTDSRIGDLLTEIDRLDLLEDTAIILTADHGESLGEHEYFFEHGWFPYNATGWVPWILYWPDMPDPGTRVAYPTGLVNLLPTILDIMGWKAGDLELHGESVVPVITGSRARAAELVFNGGGEGGLAPEEFLRTVQDGRWKLVHVPSERYQRMMQGSAFELYDVLADPMETRDLANSRPKIVERLRASMQQLVRETGPIASGPREEADYSPEQIEHLRTLGYIQ